MFHGRDYSARCFLEVAVGNVERSERATRSVPGGASTFLKLTRMGAYRTATGKRSVRDPPRYARVTIFISDECDCKNKKIGGDN